VRPGAKIVVNCKYADQIYKVPDEIWPTRLDLIASKQEDRTAWEIFGSDRERAWNRV